MIARAITTAFIPLAAAAALIGLLPVGAHAAEKDRKFFHQVQGDWSGPGEIVAGKFKGTKFQCAFKGTTPVDRIGMTLDGGCRVGLFTQKMSATIEHAGRKGYQGTFMDGAVGEGLDVVGGDISERRAVLSLHRNQLHGAMLARLPDDDTLYVTVSVKVEDQMVPVIGMNLKRTDGTAVGAIRAR